MRSRGDREALVERMDIVHSNVAAGQRELFRLICEADETGDESWWKADGARDLAHWVCMRYGISEWKANRWIACARALEALPQLSMAFETGMVGIDKVLELTRFATPETEEDLVRWANTVSSSWIKRKADLLEREGLGEVRRAVSERSCVYYYYDGGKRFRLELDVPGADGARIVEQLRRTARVIPQMPDEEGSSGTSRREADAAVVQLTSAGAQTTKATVIVHARVDELLADDGKAAVQGGEVVSAETARRMLCYSSFRLLLEDELGEPLKLGRTRRDPTTAMATAVRGRDSGCLFDGCGTRRFTEVHHLHPWGLGGVTDIENLGLLCSFHHTLTHEMGWSVKRVRGEARTYRPDGARYRAGPAPPLDPLDEPVPVYLSG
jgi:hypothetical protein